MKMEKLHFCKHHKCDNSVCLKMIHHYIMILNRTKIAPRMMGIQGPLGPKEILLKSLKAETLIRSCFQAKYVQLAANQKMRKYDVAIISEYNICTNQPAAALCSSQSLIFTVFFVANCAEIA